MEFTPARLFRIAAAAALVLVGFAAEASSQTLAGNPWGRGTTLELFAGGANASPNTTTGTVGAAVGWELNHFAEIEGVVAWLPERRGAQSFAADLNLLVNLTRPTRVVPYLGAGAGMYRGSFDATRATLPHFYQQRMPDFSSRARATFTDPTVVIAGGANVFVARHLSVRPELGVRLVLNGSDVYKVTTFTFALIYHVEDHPNGQSK
jgi:hypothetical protein